MTDFRYSQAQNTSEGFPLVSRSESICKNQVNTDISEQGVTCEKKSQTDTHPIALTTFIADVEDTDICSMKPDVGHKIGQDDNPIHVDEPNG